MSDKVLEIEESTEDTDDIDQVGPIIWTYYKIDGYQSKRGGSKNVTCLFCDNNFTGCSTTRAFAHILGRAVLGQKKANVAKCVPICKIDDDRQVLFKAAQQVLENAVGVKEREMSYYTMCDKIHGEGSEASAKAQLDWQCFYKAKKGPMFSRETTWANAAKMGPEEWYEMYVKPFHPELALVGMRVLSQVISASSCERNWSAHGHIHTEVRNRLAPATTEKLVYIYCNKKAVMAAARDDELKMFTWDNE